MLELPVFCDDRGAFTALRNRRVLLYWPHGFGDFVHLSLVVPLLEPSNVYFITRFGDDFVHLYDEGESMVPMLSGARSIGDGTSFGVAPHLGLDFDRLQTGVRQLDVPLPLASRMREANVDAVLACRYPELTGRVPYPWHTKARYLAHQLVARERLRQFDLARPLRSSLAFRAPAASVARIEARLRTFIGAGERFVLVSPGGHTQVDKCWPEREVAALARALRTRDARLRVITVDERTSAAIGRDADLAPTTTDLFGGDDVPFAHVLLVLLRQACAVVGAAAGPLHCALAMGASPVVGVWLSHWPEYYDEPNGHALHLVGPRVYRQRLDRRVGAQTLAQAGTLSYAIRAFRSRPPGAGDVLAALEELGV